MECWKYSTGIQDKHQVLASQAGISIYKADGKTRVKFARDDTSSVCLTSTQILWTTGRTILSIDLSQIAKIKKESGGRGLFSKTKDPKICITSTVVNHSHSKSGPFPAEPSHEFSIAFPPDGGLSTFYAQLEKALNDKDWERIAKNKMLLAQKKADGRRGIVGIERQIRSESERKHADISEAFQDVKSLIDAAKPMVQLINKIANTIKEKQGEFTDDDTMLFRQHLLSLGVKDPVTKNKCASGDIYFSKLAIEISNVLAQQVLESGGIMSLVEAFCRVNRARGVQLVSAEDFLQGCYNLKGLPIRLQELGDNVKVLQHAKFDVEHGVGEVLSLLEDHEWLSPEEYATVSRIPVLLAKHSLVECETRGLICRDESIEGLRFYNIGPFFA